MPRFRTWTPAALFAIFALVAAVSMAGSPTSRRILQFVPLIAVAPDEPDQAAVTSPACTTPAPVFKSAFVHCYTPSNIYAAYGVDALHSAGHKGAGQTIVIVDSYGSPTALQDLQFFSTTFGLPQPDLTIIHPDGTPPFNNSVNGAQVGWAFETSLDLQWAHAIAPDAKIVLIATIPAETEGVQGFPNMLKGEEIATVNFPGSVMSQSFAATEQSFHGAGDPQVARFDKIYQQAKANGMTVLGSSGDTGTANVDKQMRVFPFPTVNWPSSDPLVTSAGGTWLQFGWRWAPTVQASTYFTCLAAGTAVNTCRATYLSFVPGGRTEAVWKEDWDRIATGGGRSVLFATPTFQSGISNLQGSRGIPDLSWNAAVDGGVLVYTSFPGTRLGWHTVGGTSAASPQLAALIAIANQIRAQATKGPVGYLNPRLYQLPAADFNDIVPLTFGTGAGVTTLDSNAEFGSGIPGMPTTTGWDLTTGFGSPKADKFVPDLAAQP
jgi:subtilase family serine protease